MIIEDTTYHFQTDACFHKVDSYYKVYARPMNYHYLISIGAVVAGKPKTQI